MAKMNITKIFKVKRAKKPQGYNSLWLVRCNDCGELFLVWDTVMYSRLCPKCKGIGEVKTKDSQEIKNSIFRIQRRLFNEYKRNNLLTCNEISKLRDFREIESESILSDILSDCWFKPYLYIVHRKIEWTIDKRGRELLKNNDFLDLLRECYYLIYNSK